MGILQKGESEHTQAEDDVKACRQDAVWRQKQRLDWCGAFPGGLVT